MASTVDFGKTDYIVSLRACYERSFANAYKKSSARLGINPAGLA